MYKLETHWDCDCIFTVFLNFHPNLFCWLWEPRELVWESVWSILHRNFLSKFKVFFKIFKIIIWFSDFPDSRPKKIGFFAWGRFLLVFWVQKIINLFTVLQILYKFWKMFHKSFSYEPSRQYGISPFSKTIIKKSI